MNQSPALAVMHTDTQTRAPMQLREQEQHGLLIISSLREKPKRRVLFINVSGGRTTWSKYRQGLLPSNRVWGAVELVSRGYEVGIADALPDFYLHRNPLPHDLKLLGAIRDWLRPSDILYCAHNTTYWLPLMRRLGLVRCEIVSLLYSREPLSHARGHSGILALNPSAADHARRLAPQAKVAHLAWGMDLDFMPKLPYQPGVFLACGRTYRDFATLAAAARCTAAKLRVIAHQVPPEIDWPNNVDQVPGGEGWETRITYRALMHDYYTAASASLVILKDDPGDETACGFTNLLESMAMSRPTILTRTNANRSELDIEALGCGLYVPPGDSDALARAIDALACDPNRAREMGQAGRKRCEEHYNMQRFGSDLDRFFDSL